MGREPDQDLQKHSSPDKGQLAEVTHGKGGGGTSIPGKQGNCLPVLLPPCPATGIPFSWALSPRCYCLPGEPLRVGGKHEPVLLPRSAETFFWPRPLSRPLLPSCLSTNGCFAAASLFPSGMCQILSLCSTSG